MSAQINTHHVITRKEISFDDKTILALAAALSEGAPIKLQLIGCSIPYSHLRHFELKPLLQAIENCTTLQSVVIHTSEINIQSLKFLCDAFSKTKSKLIHFKFTYNTITYSHFSAIHLDMIAKALNAHAFTLQILDLSGVHFPYAESPYLYPREHEDIQAFLEKTFGHFGRMLYNSSALKSLKLSECNLGKSNISSRLWNGLKQSKSLTSLDLSNNFMNDTELMKILEALIDANPYGPSTASNLEHLNLSGNNFIGTLVRSDIIEFNTYIPFLLMKLAQEKTNSVGSKLSIDLSSCILSRETVEELFQIGKQTTLSFTIKNNEDIFVEDFIKEFGAYGTSENESILNLKSTIKRKLAVEKPYPAKTEEEYLQRLEPEFEKYLIASQKENRVKLGSFYSFSEDPSPDTTEYDLVTFGVSHFYIHFKNYLLTASALSSLTDKIKQSYSKKMSDHIKTNATIENCTIKEGVDINPFLEVLLSTHPSDLCIKHLTIDAKQFYSLCKALEKYGKLRCLNFSNIKVLSNEINTSYFFENVWPVLRSNVKLGYLELTGNDLSQLSSDKFDIFYELKLLHTLILEGCNLNSKSILEYYACMLESHPRLNHLDLSSNVITNQNATHFINAFTKRVDKTLSINLSSNLIYHNIEPWFKCLFDQKLRLKVSIYEINLSNNAFSYDHASNVDLFLSKTNIPTLITGLDRPNLNLLRQIEREIKFFRKTPRAREAELKELQDEMRGERYRFEHKRYILLSGFNSLVKTHNFRFLRELQEQHKMENNPPKPFVKLLKMEREEAEIQEQKNRTRNPS